MDVYTKSINKIFLNQDGYKELIKGERERRLRICLDKLHDLGTEITKLVSTDMWVQIENKKVYYVDSLRLLVADSTRMKCPRNKSTFNFEGFSGRGMTVNEATHLFYVNKNKNPLIDHARDTIINIGDYGSCRVGFQKENYFVNISDGNEYCNYGYLGYTDIITIPVYHSQESAVDFFIKQDLIPVKLEVKKKEWLICFSELYRKKYILEKNGEWSFSDTFVMMVLNGNFMRLNDIIFDEQNISSYFKSKEIKLSEDSALEASMLDKYLNCDYRRAEIEPYDRQLLFDIERGHWELWEQDESGFPIVTDAAFRGRNPLLDVHKNAIIGIDFGTKSTVVVCQDGSDQILPVRVGNGKYKKESKQEDYENPTVMEFRNLENFMDCYQKRNGRPETLWEDLTVSHKAAEQLKDENDSSRFYTFFTDLKQWCGDKKRQVRIRDCQGYERELPAFLELQEDDINPVELYAYYLGLFINNMRRGIFLDYILSFPVTYEKKVREKIVESFEKGIKKSLPQPVLEDAESMERFRIQQRAYEPAAYAICALQQYGFDPEEGDKVFYGIFDFGGGTTDFDFGTWEAIDHPRYDNRIKHFGAGGDQYLGGENLLEMLAFHVFKRNRTKLLQSDISFYKPVECENFVGSEALLSSSQEARLNTKQLMEKLRGLWQNDSPDDIKEIEEGEIHLLLFTNTGKVEPNFTLEVDKEELMQLLTERIEKGVKNFFVALNLTFRRDDLKNIDTINVFLAGNSSKSPIVKELFERYSTEYTKKIMEEKEQQQEGSEQFFRIYPPLGTKEAEEIQKSSGCFLDDDSFHPTGKTGVAYGLIQCASSSRVKVESEIRSSDEVKFKYYIGRRKKDKFRVIIGRDDPYNEWKLLYDASQTDFEFFYTSLPEAATNKYPVSGLPKKLCRIEKPQEDENVGIYLRAVEPTVIEYAVATESGIAQGKFIESPKRVELP